MAAPLQDAQLAVTTEILLNGNELKVVLNTTSVVRLRSLFFHITLG